MPNFSTFSQVGMLSPGHPVATGSPLLFTWPLPPASCMYSASPFPFSEITR